MTTKAISYRGEAPKVEEPAALLEILRFCDKQLDLIRAAATQYVFIPAGTALRQADLENLDKTPAPKPNPGGGTFGTTGLKDKDILRRCKACHTPTDGEELVEIHKHCLNGIVTRVALIEVINKVMPNFRGVFAYNDFAVTLANELGLPQRDGWINTYNGGDRSFFATRELADRAACRPDLQRVSCEPASGWHSEKEKS